MSLTVNYPNSGGDQAATRTSEGGQLVTMQVVTNCRRTKQKLGWRNWQSTREVVTQFCWRHKKNERLKLVKSGGPEKSKNFTLKE
jgi:hypothetical protein